ncbi:MAG: DUF1772 domain-containing protein [Desulfatiglans sp.]|jgi:uncharacterized membrane protein|nr:DUF1772 domain-containing protein [Thermodesulfobacteriota bacterium]MEE4353333.1 DUF1772 domain-containing protein [Desulfatiglans sp.]
MEIFQIALISSTFLCSLVAGFLFAFALVVMPGIRRLDDRDFLKAFQVMDRVIQNNQPLFVFVWVGSIVTLVASVLLSIRHLDGTGSLLIILAAMFYLIGVQLPTMTINIPMNNRLQGVNIDDLDETTQRSARQVFEPRWNLWNSIRTVFASLASSLLIILLFTI